jgi:hypothetical protein
MNGPLTDELVDFVESGVSILVGTRDRELRPHGTRAMGAIAVGRTRVTIFLPVACAERAVADLKDNGAIAITFSRPSDHVSIQLKGKSVGSRDATIEDRFVQERYRAAFFEQLQVCGVSRSNAKRFAYFPSVAIDVEIDSVFQQTPGPHAGHVLGVSR